MKKGLNKTSKIYIEINDIKTVKQLKLLRWNISNFKYENKINSNNIIALYFNHLSNKEKIGV